VRARTKEVKEKKRARAIVASNDSLQEYSIILNCLRTLQVEHAGVIIIHKLYSAHADVTKWGLWNLGDYMHTQM